VSAPSRRSALLERLAGLVLAVDRDHPVRVAIDGPDAAGKTVLADELAAVLAGAGRTTIRASADGFQRPRAERYARGRESPLGYVVDAFDHRALRAQLLDPLGPGGDRAYRTVVFDVAADAPVSSDPRHAPEDAVLVVDGVFLLGAHVRDAWEVSVLVLASFEERLRRARRRDLHVFDGVEELERRYRQRYGPAWELYAEWARPAEAADVVVGNERPDTPTMELGRVPS
jgi:uridine kinase